MLGVWSLREPEAAIAGAAVLWLGLVALRERTFIRATFALLLIVASLGAGHMQGRWALPTQPQPQEFLENRATVHVSGTVEALTDKANGRVEVLLREVRATPQEGESVPVGGLVAWEWDEPTYRPTPGQQMECDLRLRSLHGFRNPGGADFEWQQRLRGVFARAYTRGQVPGLAWGERPAHLAWDLRERLRQAVMDKLPADQGGAIVLGLLLGDRSRIDRTVTEDLRAAGLSHTLALSGLNVVYVAVLGWGLAWLAGILWPGVYLRLPRQKLAILLSLPLVAAYVWVGQASPSLVRSAYMFAFWGLLLLFDRGRVLLDGLFLALACILVPNPLAVFDVSLQMSAIAVAGMGVVYPWVRALPPHAPRNIIGRGAQLVWDAFSLSLSSNLVLAPVVVWYFGVFAPNFMLNLPWLPVQGLVVQILGMLGMAVALVPSLDTVARGLLGLAAWVQQGMLDMLRHVAVQGWLPVWTLLRPLWPELLGAGIVFAVAPLCKRRGPHRANAAWVLLTLGLLLMSVPHLLLLQAEAADEIHIAVLDVGQSQAVLVTAPGGHRLLVDGGGTLSHTFDIGRSVVVPYLTWGRPPRLDGIVMSHPDADHAQGLVSVLRQIDVGAMYTNGMWPDRELGRDLSAAAEFRGIIPQVVEAGEYFSLGPEVVVQVLHPGADFSARSTNEGSLVLRILWHGRALAVLPGDVQREGIEDIVDHGRDLRAEVLLLPHHGSKSSLSGMLYEGVAPRQALVSCGHLNMYHFPNPAVVEQMSQRGIPLISTSEVGLIEVLWRGPDKTMQLRTGPDQPCFEKLSFK